ncbi:MAG: digeranylgeranylglycerophospholipid reductase [Calditrichia bacterium]
MYFSNQVDERYDIIVVGAGPAGSMAAWQAARQGVRVLLLEKDPDIGTPVRCAEGVSKPDLEELTEQPAPPHWIAAEIDKFRLFAPNGIPVSVNINLVGYILHRKQFDFDLAVKAANAGARVVTCANVTGVLRNEGKIFGVEVNINGEPRQIRSRIVIAADGVESRVARWAGLDSTVRLKDMETCAQFTLTNIDIDHHTCDFYFSRGFAPGGYAWVFPKGKGMANVGLGVAGTYTKNKTPEEYLNIFLNRYFPTASIVSKTVGGVPVDKTLKQIVADGFMVAGDAAHQVNPISGGGIISGMIAGKIAGQVAAEAIKRGNTRRNALLPYAREWHRRVGKTHQRYYRLKEVLLKFDDEDLNRIALEFRELENERKTIPNLFKIAFKNNPAFLLDVFKIFANTLIAKEFD